MKGAVPAFPFKKRGQVPIFTKIGKKHNHYAYFVK